MPLGLRSPFRDTKRAPPSAQNDNDDADDLMHLPAYSDDPPSERRNGVGNDDGNDDGGTPVASDDGDREAGRGEGDSLQLDGSWGPAKYYRGGLVCAYLHHWLACRCCDYYWDASKCSRRAQRVREGLFYLGVVCCAAAIGYIVAQEGNPFERDETPDGSVRSSNPVDGGVGSAVDGFANILEEACSENSLKTLDGIQQCHDKCQTHLCCFTEEGFLAGDGHCEDVHIRSDSCVAFKPCKRLVILENAGANDSTDDSTLLEVADSVANACLLPDDPTLINGTWVATCHAACAPRLCCVLDSKLGSSCRDAVAANECAAYAPCEVLVDPNKGQVMRDPQAIGDVQNVCAVDVVQNLKERNACEFLCKQRPCCFEEDREFSCYDLEKNWCDEFQACSSLTATVLDNAQLDAGGVSISAPPKPTGATAPTESHPLNPQWYQTTHADYQLFLESKEEPGNNHTHDWYGANTLCHRQGLFLCGYDAYCPNGRGDAPFQGGPPKLDKHGTIEETQWSPFMGLADKDPTGSHWIQIGHLSVEAGGSEENKFVQCWKYDDWYAGNGVDIVEVWEAKHRVYILCCEKAEDGEEGDEP